MKKVCLRVLCFMHQLCLGINLAYRAANSKSQCIKLLKQEICTPARVNINYYSQSMSVSYANNYPSEEEERNSMIG